MGLIYKITNKVNNKVYIGKTIRNISFRYGNNMNSLFLRHHNDHLKKSMLKYGFDSFVIDVVEDGISDEDIIDREVFYINKYKSYNPDYGYNKIIKHSDLGGKCYKKVICINNGIVYDSMTEACNDLDLNIGKVSAVCNGKRRHTKGYQFAFYEEGKEYVLQDIIVGEKVNAKQVICINTQEVFKSISEASKFFGISLDSISKCCSGRHNETKEGYQFAFYEEGKEYVLQDFSKVRFNKVRCIDTGEIFDSIEDAAKYYNTSSGNIRSAIQGRSKTAKGLRWEYAGKPIKNNKHYNPSFYDNKKKPVICINTQEVFDSILSASKHFNIAKSSISNCCKGRAKKAKGLVFAFYEEGATYELPKDSVTEYDFIYKGSKAVICIDTGEVFSSAAEASYKLGKPVGNISACCRGETLTAYGYQWAFYEEGKSYELKDIDELKDRGKPVVRIDNLNNTVIYRSIKYAEKITGINSGSILACCNGNYSNAGGYQWEYYEEGKDYFFKEIYRRGKAIRCIETGVEYVSAVEASKTLDIPLGSIYKSCKTKKVTKYGYTWEYVVEL